ncbi:MAG: O-antigen ligase family protein [Phycisphaeraceae bacterium]|nr:O-antigen ligase family protein [Phycisphaeraceae bacterium]
MNPDAASPSASRKASPSRAAHLLRLIGLGLVLFVAFLHARAGHTTFPYWELDPTIAHSPLPPAKPLLLFDLLTASYNSLGPTAIILIDLFALVGAALMLLAEKLSLTPVSRRAIALAAIGSIPCLFHASVGNVADTVTAVTWLAAIWSALAIWQLTRHPEWRTLIHGLLAAFFIILVAKGAIQVFIEHPTTVKDFRSEKSTILAARGWEPGSSAALAYERRLMQPEATAWFGLSNVFSTFAALTIVLGFIAAIIPGKSGRARAITLALAGIAGLALTGSKGGIGATLAGLVCLGFLLAIRHRQTPHDARPMLRRFVTALPILVPLAVVLAVVLRGLLGERLGELSLLFRWFYMQASARIFTAEPLLGVGPGSFQDAYLLAKNPLSPEEVTSPHSIAFDWLATLGIGAVAWLALCAIMLLRAGSSLLLPARAPQHLIVTKPLAYFIGALAIGVPALATSMCSGSSLTITIASHLSTTEHVETSHLLAGLAAEVLLAAAWIWLALALGPRLAASPLVPIAAIVLFAHAQIEMTPTQPASALLFAITLAAFASPLGPPAPTGRHPTHHAGWCTPLVLTLTLAATSLLPVMDWERRLLAPARQAEPLGKFAADLRRLNDPGLSLAQQREQFERLASALAERFGGNPPRSPQALHDDLTRLRIAVNVLAAEELHLAAQRFHRGADPRTWSEAVGRALSALAASDPPPARQTLAILDLAESVTREFSDRHPSRATAWRLRGDLLSLHAATDPALETQAVGAWTTAARLDPYGRSIRERLLTAAQARGDLPEIRRLAQELLDIDDWQRLDPLRRYPEPRRAELQRLANPS